MKYGCRKRTVYIIYWYRVLFVTEIVDIDLIYYNLLI